MDINRKYSLSNKSIYLSKFDYCRTGFLLFKKTSRVQDTCTSAVKPSEPQLCGSDWPTGSVQLFRDSWRKWGAAGEVLHPIFKLRQIRAACGSAQSWGQNKTLSLTFWTPRHTKCPANQQALWGWCLNKSWRDQEAWGRFSWTSRQNRKALFGTSPIRLQATPKACCHGI